MQEREGKWGIYKGKGKHYNNVALFKTKGHTRRTCVSFSKTQPLDLRLGQNEPNAEFKAASREDAKRLRFNKRTKVMMTDWD